MSRSRLLPLVALGLAQTAHCQVQICPPLAQLARAAAVEREAGKTMQETFLYMVKAGKIDTKSPTASFAANTVVWVFNEKVSSKVAEKKMLSKCRGALKN